MAAVYLSVSGASVRAARCLPVYENFGILGACVWDQGQTGIVRNAAHSYLNVTNVLSKSIIFYFFSLRLITNYITQITKYILHYE